MFPITYPTKDKPKPISLFLKKLMATTKYTKAIKPISQVFMQNPPWRLL